MRLTNESTQKLATTIAGEVLAIVSEDDRYTSGLMTVLPQAIEDVIGQTSPELIGELGSLIMDKIGIIDEHHPYADNNIWKTRYEALYGYVKRNYAESYIDGAEYGVGTIYDGDN